MELWEKTVESETLFEGKIVTLKLDKAQLRPGKAWGRGRLPGASPGGEVLGETAGKPNIGDAALFDILVNCNIPYIKCFCLNLYTFSFAVTKSTSALPCSEKFFCHLKSNNL